MLDMQFVYEGVSFLNEEQENVLRRHIGGDDISNAADRYDVLLCIQLLITVNLLHYKLFPQPVRRQE